MATGSAISNRFMKPICLATTTRALHSRRQRWLADVHQIASIYINIYILLSEYRSVARWARARALVFICRGKYGQVTPPAQMSIITGKASVSHPHYVACYAIAYHQQSRYTASARVRARARTHSRTHRDVFQMPNRTGRTSSVHAHARQLSTY